MTKIEMMLILASTKGGKPDLFIIDIESIASIPAVHLCPVSKGVGVLKKSVKLLGLPFKRISRKYGKSNEEWTSRL